MLCENRFCIYWEDEECSCDEIELDVMGCCTTCICVDIDDEEWKDKREKALTDMEDLYENMDLK